MMRILIIVLSMFSATVYAQSENFIIKGKIGNYGLQGKVYLVSRIAGINTVDSSSIINGAFQFTGKAPKPYKVRLILERSGKGYQSNRNSDLLEVYLENTEITVIGTDSISKSVITGSKLNVDNQKLKIALAQVDRKLKSLYDEYYVATTEKQKSKEFELDIDKRSDVIDIERKQIIGKYIKENPTTFVSLDAIRSYGGPTPDVNELEPLFNLLSPELKNSDSGKELFTIIVNLKALSIGAVAPDFSQTDSSQHIIKLSDLRGKYVLLDFWASWCGPCRNENPNVVKAYHQFKDKNFTVLGVSLDKKRESWVKAIQDDHLTWNHVSDLKFWNNEVARIYSIQSIPQNFLIDPNGKIIAKNIRGDELIDKLTLLLK